LNGTPLVSILVIAEAGDPGACVQQLLERTAYPAFEILAVSAPREEIADARVRWVASETEALAAVQGDLIARLSADTFVLQADWLEALVAHTQQRAVGAVAPRLVGPDQRLIGVGLTLGLGADGIAGALHAGIAIDAPGYLGRAQCAQELSALPRQCLLMQRAHAAAWQAVSAQPAPYAEAAFGVRLRRAGIKLVWTPAVTMLCLGNALRSADPETTSEAAKHLLVQALPPIARDPAYNRNLSLRWSEPTLEGELAARWDTGACDAVRILGAGFGSPGSWQYRGVQPLVALEQSAQAQLLLLGDAAEVVRMPNVTELARLAPQTLLLHNTVHDTHIEVLRNYRRHNDVTIVFGQDDLMTDLPPKNPFSRTVFRDYKKRLRQCLALSDRLVVTTEPLAAAYRDWIDDICVVPNRLPKVVWQDLCSARRAGRKPRVGWAGAMQHAGDLDWLADVVRDLADEVEWVFLGMCPEPMRPYLAELHGAVAFADYPAKLASLNLDLALAPLEHNRFNECKSNLRVLEYGALGWPVLASDIEPYRSTPVVRLANKPQAWAGAIRERIHDLDGAARDGDQLRAWVHANWMLEDHLSEWLNVLMPRAAARDQVRAPTKMVAGG
jgi:glycosyltransferase involved in cell wall biosynthesis